MRPVLNEQLAPISSALFAQWVGLTTSASSEGGGTVGLSAWGGAASRIATKCVSSPPPATADRIGITDKTTGPPKSSAATRVRGIVSPRNDEGLVRANYPSPSEPSTGVTNHDRRRA